MTQGVTYASMEGSYHDRYVIDSGFSTVNDVWVYTAPVELLDVFDNSTLFFHGGAWLLIEGEAHSRDVASSSCAGRSCDVDDGQECQCDALCKQREDCCEDVADHCAIDL